MSDTTLVWVPKHLAKDIEAVTSTEGLDEYVAMYKGLSATARLEFTAACQEAVDKSWSVFEEYDKRMPDITEKVRGIVETILPAYKELDRLAHRLDHVDVARLHSALDLAERIASMSDETRQALTAMLGTDADQ